MACRPGEYGVGMIFCRPIPRNATMRVLFEDIVATEAGTAGLATVPTEHSSLGQTAIASEPIVRQVFHSRVPTGWPTDLASSRKLYVIANWRSGASALGPSGAGDKFSLQPVRQNDDL